MLLSEHLFIIGAAPLITLGTTYLDENLDKVTESSKIMAQLKVHVGTGFPIKDARLLKYSIKSRYFILSYLPYCLVEYFRFLSIGVFCVCILTRTTKQQFWNTK